MEVMILLPDKNLKITVPCDIIQHLIPCSCKKNHKLQKIITWKNNKLKLFL